MNTAITPESGLLELAGEIDLHESPQVKAQLEPLIAAKTPRILVDLSGVSYIDSSGLALFIEAMQRAQAYGGKFSLCSLRPNVRVIFDISRLDQVFTIFPNREAAVAA
jgi:anti-sigma B factor antagonist